MVDLERAVESRAVQSDVTLYMYTKGNPSTAEVLRINDLQDLKNSRNFDSGRDNIFLIHGWTDSQAGDMPLVVRQAILNVADMNVFVVDWSKPAGQLYSDAVASVPIVGGFLGGYINKMMGEFSLSPNKFRLVGYSLGAHVAGCTGAAVNGQVWSIVGLDSAGPLFTVSNTNNRLDPSDAQFVQVIHTNDGTAGFSNAIGHVDYRPNGGRSQPGCGIDLLGSCSHSRSYQYFAESIGSSTFTSTKCANYNNFQGGQCNNNEKSKLGELEVDRR
jgi:pancreatic triacylglycerol lipase